MTNKTKMSEFERDIERLKRSMRGIYLIAQKDIADDINERTDKVMSNYENQINALKEQLADANRLIKENCNCYKDAPREFQCVYCRYQQKWSGKK